MRFGGDFNGSTSGCVDCIGRSYYSRLLYHFLDNKEGLLQKVGR